MRIAIWAVVAIALLVVLAGMVLHTPDKSRSELNAKYRVVSSDYRMVAGVRLRLKDTGPRAAPAVVLIHGFGSSLETWDAWADALSADYRVVRFDLPGFGLTGPDPTNDYSDARSTAILAALLDELGIARASLVGNSLGGRIAWRFAADHPARVVGLVLISPDGFASKGFDYGKKAEPPFILRLLPYTLPRWLLRSTLAPAYADPSRLTEATVTRYRDMMLAPGVRNAIIAMTGQVMLQDPVPLLRRIQAPTLLLWGEEDRMIPFTNAADYARALPHATLAALPGLGHVPFEESPAASLAPVRQFLGTVTLRD